MESYCRGCFLVDPWILHLRGRVSSSLTLHVDPGFGVVTRDDGVYCDKWIDLHSSFLLVMFGRQCVCSRWIDIG